jgi:ribosomal protein L28
MRHTKRRWNVNVQQAKVVVDGKLQSKALCTSCLKTLNKTR